MNDENRAQPLVQVRNLRKRFGDLVVLDGVDLDLAAGEHVAIIGRSGSGKSTLLRLLMTLEQPDAGTIRIDGDYLWHQTRNDQLVPASGSHTRRVRGKVGMVFQHFNLFPHMTVLRNVSEAPRLVLGLSKQEADQRARQLLDRVGLAAKSDAWPQELSGGQKQRVAIARALAMRPQLMLFDEVTSALDPELVGEALEFLRELAGEVSMTMLVVTHQMHFAEQIANRVLFLDRGKVVEDDTPAVIFHHPREVRTREFLNAVLAPADD
jgi:polar amino acid transport system ATP-binding protein